MSTLRLLIIKGNTLYNQECHFRQGIDFLNSPEPKQEAYLAIVRAKTYLDAGYVLVDYDNEFFVSNQSAFSFHHLSKKKQELFFHCWKVLK